MNFFDIENKKKNNQKNDKKNDKKNKGDMYTIIDFPKEGTNYGEFFGKSPKRAAEKAFTKLARLSKTNNSQKQFIVFSILNKDTNKEYKYIGTRIKLVNPIEVTRGGKKIIYRYMNTIGKYRKELNREIKK
jgi:hypothetical protein